MTRRNLWPAIFWALLIFSLSSLPSSAIPDLGVSFGDVVLHFLFYAVFGYLISMAVLQEAHKFAWRFYLLVFLLGSLYGVSDEFHQSFVPGRYTEVSDFLADSAGVLLGLFCFVKWPMYVRKPAAAPDHDRREPALPAETKDRR